MIMLKERSYNEVSLYSTRSPMDIVELGPPEMKRWYILIIYSIISSLQCNAWFTFSSVPDEVQQYYHLKDPGDNKVNSTIDILLNYGPIMFLSTAPFAAYLLLYPLKGLRFTTILAVNFTFFGCLIRSIPSILQDLNIFNYKITNSFWNTLIFLHIGQIFINIAGPLVMGPPSKLSVIWFPEWQRTTATSIAAISNGFGECFGFLIGPLIVRKTAGNINHLLYFDLILISIPWLLVLIYFPSSPNKLPSIAGKAALLSVPVQELKEFMDDIKLNESTSGAGSGSISLWNASSERNRFGTRYAFGNDDQLLGRPIFGGSDVDHIVNNTPYLYKSFTLIKHLKNLFFEIKCMILSISTLFVVLSGGMFIGSMAGWSVVLQDMIGKTSGLDLNDDDIGIFGFVGTLTVIFGALTVAPITDKWFAKKLKMIIFLMFLGIIICYGLLLFIVPSPWSNKPMILLNENDSLKKKMLIITIINGICGLCIGGSIPLFYELCAEVSYPVSEGSSVTFLVFIENISLLIFVGVANWISTQWETILTLTVCIFAAILLMFVKEKYRRM